MDDFQTGLILSAGPLAAVAALLIWGRAADRAKYKNDVTALLLVTASVVFFALSASGNFWFLFIGAGVFMFFMSPHGGLVDSITLEQTTKARIKYGPIRALGTAGFCAVSLVLTFFTEIDIQIIFISYAVFAVLAAITIKLAPPVRGYAKYPMINSDSREKNPESKGFFKAQKRRFANKNQILSKREFSLAPFFKDKKYISVLIILAAVQIGNGCLLNFLPAHLTFTLGKPQWAWGVTCFFNFIGEIAIFFFFDKLINYFGPKKLVWFSVATQAARLLVMAFFGSSMLAVVGINFLTGSFPNVIAYCLAYYINKNAAPSLRASGQTLYFAIGLNLPRFAAGVAGGFAVGAAGFPAAMLMCGIFTLILFVFYPLFNVPTKIDEPA